MSKAQAQAEYPRLPDLDGGVERLPTWRYVLHLIRFPTGRAIQENDLAHCLP